MSWLIWIVVILALVAAAWSAIWFVMARRLPEQAASPDRGRQADPRGHTADVAERPGDPGAESQRVEGRGPLRPGP